MEKICGVIDCKGFQFKDRFIPREIAIAPEYMSQCQEFNARINWRFIRRRTGYSFKKH